MGDGDDLRDGLERWDRIQRDGFLLMQRLIRKARPVIDAVWRNMPLPGTIDDVHHIGRFDGWMVAYGEYKHQGILFDLELRLPLDCMEDGFDVEAAALAAYDYVKQKGYERDVEGHSENERNAKYN